MSITGVSTPLRFRQLARAELACLQTLDIEPVERFLEPIPAILAQVRRGPAHAVVAIEQDGQLAGFYVVHPDPRDKATWWLGWLALDRAWQGRGLGRQALMAVLARLTRVSPCRRVRLLVAPDNGHARALYQKAGFIPIGRAAITGELILERAQPSQVTATEDGAPGIPASASALAKILAMALRLWKRGVPAEAKLSGQHHGPPAPMAIAGRWRAVCF